MLRLDAAYEIEQHRAPSCEPLSNEDELVPWRSALYGKLKGLSDCMLALIVLLHASRSMPAALALPAVWLAIYVALVIGNRGILPVSGPSYFGVAFFFTTTAALPFALDRLAAFRLGGFGPMLLFPMAWVAAEFLRSRFAPGATWGSIAYTQYGYLPVMQVAALIGSSETEVVFTGGGTESINTAVRGLLTSRAKIIATGFPPFCQTRQFFSPALAPVTFSGWKGPGIFLPTGGPDLSGSSAQLLAAASTARASAPMTPGTGAASMRP